MFRLFIAIALPETVRAGLTLLQSGVPGARWVPAENFHLTLRFIGEVDGLVARDIDTELLRLRSPGFELAIAGVGHFGDGAAMRALYAAVPANPALSQLQAKVDSAIAMAHVAPERRKFVPHVTLARFGKQPDIGHHLAQFMASHALFKSDPFAVETFGLYSSFASKSGSVYRLEAEYPLG